MWGRLSGHILGTLPYSTRVAHSLELKNFVSWKGSVAEKNIFMKATGCKYVVGRGCKYLFQCELSSLFPRTWVCQGIDQVNQWKVCWVYWLGRHWVISFISICYWVLENCCSLFIPTPPASLLPHTPTPIPPTLLCYIWTERMLLWPSVSRGPIQVHSPL